MDILYGEILSYVGVQSSIHIQPWSNLNKSLLHVVYLEQVMVHYNLEDVIWQVGDWNNDGPVAYERVLKNCMSQCGLVLMG